MIIRPAVAADVDGMVDLLHTHMNAKFSKERWRRLFTYKWCRDKPDFGRVAVADGGIVGCVAAVYSDRLINGSSERIVNPAAWYLRKEARGADIGFRLMADLTSNADWHHVISTSSKYTIGLLRRIGFTELDDAKYVWRYRSNGRGIRCLTDRELVRAEVSDNERRILDDHASMPVTPMLFHADGQSALIMFAETTKGAGEVWLDVLYVGDPEFLAHHGRGIAGAVLRRPNMIMAADCRFCARPPEGTEHSALDVARYVKSMTLGGHHIDHLYSELQLLDQKLR